MKNIALVSNLPKGTIIIIPSLYVHGHDNKYYCDGSPREKTAMGEGYWFLKIDRKDRLTDTKEFITIKQLHENGTKIEVPEK